MGGNNSKLICCTDQLVNEGLEYDQRPGTARSTQSYCYRCGDAAVILLFNDINNKHMEISNAVSEKNWTRPPDIRTPFFLWESAARPDARSSALRRWSDVACGRRGRFESRQCSASVMCSQDYAPWSLMATTDVKQAPYELLARPFPIFSYFVLLRTESTRCMYAFSKRKKCREGS